ncbi:hypothetical protein GCM10010449_38620 [Streptomyces rectiviolaceus]|uniref:Uncharacterized protein n=1 Tax=Streptomyces rectiviolaceus TaxID=332591 RepID=A0ABP6MHW6_9ACTN
MPRQPPTGDTDGDGKGAGEGEFGRATVQDAGEKHERAREHDEDEANAPMEVPGFRGRTGSTGLAAEGHAPGHPSHAGHL